jgi:hypothetical protein
MKRVLLFTLLISFIGYSQEITLNDYNNYVYQKDIDNISSFGISRGYVLTSVSSNGRVYSVNFVNYNTGKELSTTYNYTNNPKINYNDFVNYETKRRKEEKLRKEEEENRKKLEEEERLRKEEEKRKREIILKRRNSISWKSFKDDLIHPNTSSSYSYLVFSYSENENFFNNHEITNKKELIGNVDIYLEKHLLLSLRIEVENLFNNNTTYYINNVNIGNNWYRFMFNDVLIDGMLNSMILPKKIDNIKPNIFSSLTNRYNHVNNEVNIERYYNKESEFKINFSQLMKDYILSEFINMFYNNNVVNLLDKRIINYLIINSYDNGFKNIKDFNIETLYVERKKKKEEILIKVDLGNNNSKIWMIEWKPKNESGRIWSYKGNQIKKLLTLKDNLPHPNYKTINWSFEKFTLWSSLPNLNLSDYN